MVGKLYGTLATSRKRPSALTSDKASQGINANWLITADDWDDFYTKDQQALIDEIVKKVTAVTATSGSRSRRRTTTAAWGTTASPCSAPPVAASASGNSPGGTHPAG